MNCKEIKAAIDMASRRNPISNEANAHLSGCPDCLGYSAQASSLLALLSAQPRVEAPADFDFKLRARIARAQAQPAGPFAFLENFFGQSFSLKQAAASLAALAVMAAGTTFYFTQQGNQPVTNAPVIAHNREAVAPVKIVPDTAVNQQGISAPAPKMPAPRMVAETKSRVSAESLKPAALTAVARPQSNLVATAVSKEDMIRVFNREKGQVNEFSARPVVYGAEGMAMAKPAAYAGF